MLAHWDWSKKGKLELIYKKIKLTWDLDYRVNLDEKRLELIFRKIKLTSDLHIQINLEDRD